MTIEVNMEDSGYVEGINLWRLVECKPDTAKTSGSPMLVLKLRAGSSEITDRVMLAGGGWKLGRRKLMALGVAENHKGAIDPLSFLNKLLWVATIVKPNTYIKDGETKTVDRLEVDINQLKYAGLQPANDPPPGFTAPPADVDETPF